MTLNADPIPAVQQDMPCVRCGYNVRGLAATMNCPECGLGVGRSMRVGAELDESRPAWLRGIWFACALLLCVHLGLALLAALALYLLSSAIQSPWPVWVAIGLSLVHFAGAWLLTRPEHPHANPQYDRTLRITLRLLSIGPVIAGAALAANILLQDRSYLILTWAGLSYIFCPLLEFMLLRRLARRLLDPRLVEHATIVAWGYTITLACLTVPDAMKLTQQRAFSQPLFELTGLFLFWLWACLILVSLASAFEIAARKAAGRWRQADAAVL